MTSIYDVPYKDIQEFLLANNETYDDENDAYNKALELLKDKKAKGHTTSIIEWLMAHNLSVRNINIPNYTTTEINKMSQNEINNLARLLKMSGNNIVNIKNILKYLHKLDNNNKILLPVSELNDIIFSNLSELESKDINFDILEPYNAVKLLKTHNNKALVRKLIYNNMEKIILYNYLVIDKYKLDKLPYFEDLTYQLPKSVILELLRINEKNLLKNYKIEEINDFLNFLEENERGVGYVELYRGIEDFTQVLIDLIEINEITLAKKVFDIANEYKFKGQIAHNGYSFNQYLVQILATQKDNVVDTLLKFLGEDYFLKEFEIIAIYKTNTNYIKQLLPKLINLERYDLFLKILNLIIIRDRGHKGTSPIIKMVLPNLEKAIDENNNNVLIKYLDILNLALDGKLSKNTALNMMDEINKDFETDKS